MGKNNKYRAYGLSIWAHSGKSRSIAMRKKGKLGIQWKAFIFSFMNESIQLTSTLTTTPPLQYT